MYKRILYDYHVLITSRKGSERSAFDAKLDSDGRTWGGWGRRLVSGISPREAYLPLSVGSTTMRRSCAIITPASGYVAIEFWSGPR